MPIRINIQFMRLPAFFLSPKWSNASLVLLPTLLTGLTKDHGDNGPWIFLVPFYHLIEST
jgi:hypothetical protein